MNDHADIVIVGAGAAGLMCAIHAAGGGRRVVLVDGARKLGAKILVAGGGRCNVTHERVSERDFAGSTAAAIRKVLRRFSVDDTVQFFAERGVELKREETGKLFPVTDRARTVLNALLDTARSAGVEIRHPWRAEQILRLDTGGFRVIARDDSIEANHIVLATGGKSLPKSGSDGHGYNLAKSLGHTITERIFPALVPLKLGSNNFLTGLSGIASEVSLEVRAGTGKRLATFSGALLCTHFGLSGPVVLDISRYLIDARLDDPNGKLIVNWLPGNDFSAIDSALLAPGKDSIGRWLGERLPRRLADALCEASGIEPNTPRTSLLRDHRRALAHTLIEMELPITGDRGYTFAEVTAGGVPLAELDLATMQSRRCPGLWMCGEICDVDGRIGGFNFQWAWASGFVAGVALKSVETVDERG